MALADKLVFVGTVPYDRTGDKGQVPFLKYNAAITELYGDIAAIIASANFTWVQSLSSSLWTIVHNMGRFPDVTVIDSSNRVIEGDVQYVDANTVTVAFSAPFSGEAYLN